MSRQAILVAVPASSELLGARRTVASTLDGPRSVVLTASNFTDFELVLDHAEHQHGTFSTPPGNTLPARTAMVFSARGTGSLAGPKGRLDWVGAHPDRGEFHFELAWGTRSAGESAASARCFHRLPWPTYVEFMTGRDADGMPVETDFLHTSAVAATVCAGGELHCAPHRQDTRARSTGTGTQRLEPGR